MEYNTRQRKLPLPEYGRSVQQMVDHALTLASREERQRCAETIVSIMGSMFPDLRDAGDSDSRLWDHLAIMADFRLDIDYPVEVVRREDFRVRPEPIRREASHIRYRHYGRLIEDAIEAACALAEGPDRRRLVNLIVNHMKKDYLNWNKDGVENRKILDDLCELSGGRLRVSPDEVRLGEPRLFFPRKRAAGADGRRRKFQSPGEGNRSDNR